MRIGRMVGSLAFLVCTLAAAQQMAEPKFDTSVAHPAYVSEHPKVVIDEAHNNFHTAGGRYKPLADLLRHDGYEVARGTKAFFPRSLAGVRVLIVANALGPGANAGTDTSPPAFTQAQCDAVRDWVRGGGSLLLISDHTPFGAAAEMLGQAFGVRMGKGFVWVLDRKYADGAGPTRLLFSRENGLLGDHPIMRGRSAAEWINRVVTFTGQSLSIPEGATPLLKLAPEAYEAANRAELREVMRNLMAPGMTIANLTMNRKQATGAQGIAMQFGKGRVVVLGEAALLSAQVARQPNGRESPMGMNVPGNDDRRFALNILHWLSGLLN